MRPRTEPAEDREAERQRTYTIGGQALSAPQPAAGLYIVATPIGNLGDITIRALETLAGVNLIACEDTRVTRKLLDRFGITTPLSSYHEHNAAVVRPRLIEKLRQGQSIALVSDAGTPLISDPGFKLVTATYAANVTVTALPGASSVLTALSVAGLPTDRFFFEGFLPAKTVARRARIAALASIEATLVLFESGARVGAMLNDLSEILGDRDAAICRELTKLHEQVVRGKLATLAADSNNMETRGEFVIVVSPPSDSATRMGDAELDQALRLALADGSVKDAVAEISAVSGRARRDVYARALELTRHKGKERENDDGDR